MQESETFTLSIPSSWNREVEKIDASMETMPMLQREVGCDPMKPFHASTQTETTMEERLSARGILISKETIDMILEGIEDASRMNKYFEKLEAFRKTEKLQLVLIKRIQLESNEKLPIVGIKCGRNGRIALLLGHSQHETWCFHTGKIIIFHKNHTTNIPLASCPTQLVFAPQQQVN
uniref:Uncharacterized protein n=1 Tax=Panagrolaimus sp. ES5 TaxID=591445 RepID=A0AC34FY62_9BILA